jgi:hypothetical protein
MTVDEKFVHDFFLMTIKYILSINKKQSNYRFEGLSVDDDFVLVDLTSLAGKTSKLNSINISQPFFTVSYQVYFLLISAVIVRLELIYSHHQCDYIARIYDF